MGYAALIPLLARCVTGHVCATFLETLQVATTPLNSAGWDGMTVCGTVLFRSPHPRTLQALNMEHTRLGTVMTAAARSQDPSMVREVGECVKGNVGEKHEVIQDLPRVPRRCILRTRPAISLATIRHSTAGVRQKGRRLESSTSRYTSCNIPIFLDWTVLQAGSRCQVTISARRVPSEIIFEREEAFAWAAPYQPRDLKFLSHTFPTARCSWCPT